MANLREYYEKDFGNTTKFYIEFPFDHIEGVILYDFIGYFAYIICFIPDKDKDINYFIDFIKSIQSGSKVIFKHNIKLPSIKTFPGELRYDNTPPNFELLAKFYGEINWISTKELNFSKRFIIYSESILSNSDVEYLINEGKKYQLEIMFRSENYRFERSKNEKPLAFICHDSRDKDDVAKKIAIGLQRLLCPVWYDEFSLKIGDKLRENIEKGLKECKKCIIILSPNFISNNGWTKVEFDSIFTRQILEEQNLVLPVWYNILKNDVYNYCPSLLNIKGLDWLKIGEEEVCRQIYTVLNN